MVIAFFYLTMQKYYFWLFGFILSTKLFSQSYETGISVLAYTTVNQNSYQRDTLSYIFIKNRNVQPVLTFNRITKKDLDINLQVGFFYISRTIYDKAEIPVSYIFNQKASLLQKSAFIRVGIAKRFYKEKLILISGINIPFEYCYYKKNNYYSWTYLRDTIQSKTESHTTYTPEYTTGINLQQSVYYPLTKHIYLGIDLNLGLRIYIINGVRTDKKSGEDFINPQSNYQIESKADFHQSVTRSLYFQPSVSIKYNFKKKNEK